MGFGSCQIFVKTLNRASKIFNRTIHGSTSRYNLLMNKLFFASLLIVCNPVVASVLTPIAKSTCQAAYLDLFSKDEINMTIAFGYDDVGGGKTNDLHNLKFFEQTLTSKCLRWDQRLCGFKLQSTHPTVVTKRMFGPDARLKTVRVTMEASSVSDDDSANRRNPQQKLQTEAVRKLFADGLENSEITFYQGHSRDGGGPSFGPPKLTSTGHVNYDYYHHHKDDKDFMVEALSKNPDKSRIVALISCSSIRWFSKSIDTLAPASGIIGTDATFATSDFHESLTFMENIFSFQCLKSLKSKGENEANIILNKEFKVSESSKLLTKTQIDQRTLNTLVTYLRSPDPSVQKNAYREIKTYDERLYSAKVRQEIANYTFSTTMSKSFNGRGY